MVTVHVTIGATVPAAGWAANTTASTDYTFFLPEGAINWLGNGRVKFIANYSPISDTAAATFVIGTAQGNVTVNHVGATVAGKPQSVSS